MFALFLLVINIGTLAGGLIQLGKKGSGSDDSNDHFYPCC